MVLVNRAADSLSYGVRPIFQLMKIIYNEREGTADVHVLINFEMHWQTAFGTHPVKCTDIL